MCLCAELVGGLLTAPAIRSGWYDTLAKPVFNPPAWVFGSVWTVLFLLMAVSVWLVWQQAGDKPVGIPIILFTLQLVLNVTWSGLFFGLRSPGLALMEIIVLWTLILVVTTLFYRIHLISGILMVPYLAWVSFAVVLNGFIWWMNRGLPPLTGGIIS
jgi:tryptophan-rich sensory protein